MYGYRYVKFRNKDDDYEKGIEEPYQTKGLGRPTF